MFHTQRSLFLVSFWLSWEIPCTFGVPHTHHDTGDVNLRKIAKSILALGGVILLVSGTSTSAFSSEETRGFDIFVSETQNLCEAHEAEFPQGDPMFWGPDQFVQLADLNSLETGIDSIIVGQATTIDMRVGLNWEYGSECDPETGNISSLDATGTVTAVWTVTGLTMNGESCPSDTPCPANNVGEVWAQMATPANEVGNFPGTVTITWVPE